MMRKALSSQEFGEVFASFKETAFRLETLDIYQTQDEKPYLEKFLAGDKNLPQINREWTDLIKDSCLQGKRISRVHAMTFPPTPYVRFEIDYGYKFSLEAGEHIALLDRQLLPSKFESIGDFWLFDSKTLISLEYEIDGQFRGGFLDDSQEILSKSLAAQETLPHLAMPLRAYLDQSSKKGN